MQALLGALCVQILHCVRNGPIWPLAGGAWSCPVSRSTINRYHLCTVQNALDVS